MVPVAGPSPARNDSTLTAEWPKTFDTRNDIFVPGKVDTFIRELRAALQTRGLLDSIEQRAPTLQEIASFNPNATGDQVSDMYDIVMATRHKAHVAAAAKLPSVIKLDSLTHLEMKEINELANSDDAPGLYTSVKLEDRVVVGHATRS